MWLQAAVVSLKLPIPGGRRGSGARMKGREMEKKTRLPAPRAAGAWAGGCCHGPRDNVKGQGRSESCPFHVGETGKQSEPGWGFGSLAFVSVVGTPAVVSSPDRKGVFSPLRPTAVAQHWLAGGLGDS